MRNRLAKESKGSLSLINNNSIIMSQKSLDYLWEKQKTTMNNIANVETPGFKSKHVTFENELRRKLSFVKNGTNHTIRNKILDTDIKIHSSANESNKMDGNNVNLDIENVELARTTLQYEYVLKAINDEFTRLRTAIKGQ